MAGASEFEMAITMNNLPLEEIPVEITEAARKLEMFFANKGAKHWQLMGVRSRDNDTSVDLPFDLHFSTRLLVLKFAEALAEKLAAAEKKYGYSHGWMDDDWEYECRKKLREHLDKGDPRDVANYCAFMWHHGWSTKAPQ